ncbi:hydrolase [Streptomyces filipinensis]|uniref:Hydrolase n=1 Tax=Streptomyces filipinensis TaxID=66887 RepID=A0A918MAQ2_9ACTN|nr:VOC family protein [Streptomyces filipinensis]GGU89400.1 hydrolase [Streptomyces filipinensis]
MTAFAAGSPCWVDVSVPDLEAARRFYGALLGWTFEPGDERFGSYTPALKDGKSVAALAPAQGGAPAAWNLYFATPDAQDLARRIGEAGGKVVVEPTAIGDAGTLLVATDPGGAHIGAWQPGTRAGFDVQGVPGSFFWPEIYTRDKDAVDPFYETVFGFTGQQISDGPFDFKLWFLQGNPQPVAGRLQMGEFIPAEVPAHALVYFSVADTDETVAKVLELGGSVSREPSDSPFGRSALVADDQGARFAVMGPVKDAGAAAS